MNNKIFAAIDIGSNAIRLLLKEVDIASNEKKINKLQLVRVPLRLGTEAFSKGEISKETVNKMISLMKAFRHLMKIFEVSDYRACATSAMRKVSNNKRIIRKVHHKTGIKIEIISGEEEARLLSDIRIKSINKDNPSSHQLFVDVGGGSTELNLFENNNHLLATSFNIGTVRILQDCVKPETYDSFKETLLSLKNKYSDFAIVGTGGNINKLVRLQEKKNGRDNFISTDSLQRLYDDMTNMSIDERIRKYNLKGDRAEVIVPAASIFLEVVNSLSVNGIAVPTAGLADGIINELFKQYCVRYHIA